MLQLRTAILPVAPLLVSLGVLYIGHALAYSTIPLALQGLAADPLMIGAAGTLYMVGYSSGSQIILRILQRLGHIRLYAASASLYFAALLIAALGENTWVWLVARFVMGIGFGGLTVIAEGWLNAKTSGGNRGTVLGVYVLLTNASWLVAQGVLSSFETVGLPMFALVACLFGFAIVPLTIADVEQPSTVSVAGYSLRRLFSASPAGFVGVLICGTLTGGFLALGPAVVDPSPQPDLDLIARFLMAYFIGATVLQYPIGRASDRLDRRTVMLGLAILATVVSAVLGLMWQDLPPTAMLLVVGLAGGAFGGLYPVALAHANDFVDDSDRIGVSAACVLTYAIGAAIGPLVVSNAMQQLGERQTGFWLAMAAMGLTLVIFVVVRMLVRAAPPLADQGSHVTISPTTVNITLLDPLSPEEDEEDLQLPLPLAFGDGTPA